MVTLDCHLEGLQRDQILDEQDDEHFDKSCGLVAHSLRGGCDDVRRALNGAAFLGKTRDHNSSSSIVCTCGLFVMEHVHRVFHQLAPSRANNSEHLSTHSCTTIAAENTPDPTHSSPASLCSNLSPAQP